MNFVEILGTGLTQALGPGVIVFALAAIGLNVQFGYAGLLNFGQAAFAAVGAYGVAIGVASLGLPFGTAVLLGLGLAILLGLLLGIPTLRLRADYLAIATIALAEIIRRTARSKTLSEYTGGSTGVRNFSDTFDQWGEAMGFARGGNIKVEIGGDTLIFFTSADLWVMTVGWTLIAVISVVVWLAMRSPWGRVLRGIREDEQAVRSLGKDVFSFKVQALVLGGAIGGVAGLIQAVRFGNVAPDLFHTNFTFYVYAVLILGGAARIFGPILGALLFWGLYNLLDAFLRQVVGTGVVPEYLLTTTKVGPLVFCVLSAGVIMLLIFRPQGILGDKREMSLNVR